MKAPAGQARSSPNLSSLWRRWRMPALALLVLGLVLGGGTLLWGIYLDARSDAHEAAVSRELDAFLAALGQPLEEQRQQIDTAMRAAGLAEAVAAGDAGALSTALERVAGAVDGIQGLRFIPRDQRDTDYTGQPPVSYATLDLLRQARGAEEQPPVEAHLYGTDAAHVAVLRRVLASDGELLGHLLAAYPPALLESLLGRAPLPNGFAALVQTVPGAPALRLASQGDAALRGALMRVSHRLEGSNLRVQVHMPELRAGRLEALGNLVPVAVSIVVLVVIGGLAAVLALRRRSPRRGRVQLGGAVATVVLDGGEPADPTVGAARGARAAPARPTESISLDELDGPRPPPLPASAGAPLPEVEEVEEVAAASDLERPFGLTDAETVAAPAAGALVDAIFRAYDIRGLVGEALNAESVRLIARAIGTEAFERGQQTIVVARDGRLSSDELCKALIEGLTSTGRDVVDIGRVPTPVLYFATYFLNTGSGVMLTGSHNPAQYNGLKIMLGGETLFGDTIQALKHRARSGDLRDGTGQVQSMDLLADYIRRVTEDMPVALGSAYRVVVDCGNGVASEVAPKLIRALGHDVVELHCKVDGNFPNHHPDPSRPENLQDLVEAVRRDRADLGIAFDGDGDRIGVVDDTGAIIWPDRLMMLFARDILAQSGGGPIVFDVKCSSRLRALIERCGGEPVMGKTGHSYMRNKLQETGAELAGDLSGHIFFNDRWYGFDDALYAAARLLEILLAQRKRPSALFAEVPTGVTTPELHIELAEGEAVGLMSELQALAAFDDAQVHTIDGLRAEFSDGWGLVRASNTTPSLSLRFEADDEAALARVQDRFRAVLERVRPGAALPF